MKVKQFKRSNWRVWEALSEEDRRKQIEILNYIEHLGSSTSTDISDWDMLTLFGAGEPNNTLKADKAELNQIFFKARENYVATLPQTKFEFDDEARKRISEITNSVYNSTLKSYEDEIKRIENDITDHCRQLDDLRQRLFHRTLEVEQIREAPNDRLCKEIENVCADGFYTFERLTTDNVLYMQTTGSVVLRHKGESLDFGRFRVKLRLGHASLEVLPLENNLHIDFRLPHPHVDNGNICWGNAASNAQQALGRGNFAEVFELLRGLLTIYNPENPYAEFSRFQRASRLRNYEKFRCIQEDQRQAADRGEDTSVYPSRPKDAPQSVMDKLKSAG